MPSTIPLELYRSIIDYLDDTPTLLSLLLVSRSVSKDAERALYRTIVLPVHSEQSARVLERLNDCEKVAHLVTLIHIISDHTRSDFFYASVKKRNWELLLRSALLKTVRLQVLICRAPFLQLPMESYQFKLKELRWSILLGGREFWKFVAQQPSLTSLVVGNIPFGDPPLTSYPDLSVLGAYTAVLRALLPSAKVRRLRWIIPVHETLGALPEIAPYLAPLCTLSLVGHGVAKSLSGPWPHFASLHHLELVGNWDNFEEFIKKIPRLRCLTIVGGVDGFGATALDGDGVRLLFKALPDLRFVEMQTKPDEVRLWERGSDATCLIPAVHDWRIGIP